MLRRYVRSKRGAIPFLEAIIDSRRIAIEALLQICIRLVNTYVLSSQVCREPEYGNRNLDTASDAANECDGLALGSFMKGIGKCGLWPIPTDSTTVKMSVWHLEHNLLRINYPRKNNFHEKCKFTTTFWAHVRQIRDEMQSGVLDEHHEHLAEQERKRSTVAPRS